MKRTVELVEKALAARGFEVVGDHAQCPKHNGKDRNLSIFEKADGTAGVECHSQGCDFRDIFRAIGLEPVKVPMPAGRREYTAYSGGKPVAAKHVRVDDGKGNKVPSWVPAGVVRTNELDLYRSWELNGTNRVVIVEGERATDALRELHIQAVGTYGKTYKPSQEALAMLDGYDVVLWPDKADEAHMADVAKRLGRPVEMVDTSDPSIPHGWDAADASPELVMIALESVKPYVTRPAHEPTRLVDISTDPPLPMVLERLDPEGHTILFGDGDVGKGTLVAYWVKRLAKMGKRVLIVDYESHPTEWARRTDGLGLSGQDRLNVWHIQPLAWEHPGSIWDNQDEIKMMVDANGIDFLVVDSLVPACIGVEPIAAEAAQRYTAALTHIGKPCLSIAHVNRAGDMSKPFGTAFWHNLARMTWSMEPDGENRILTHRKANNYARLAKQQVQITYEYGKPVAVIERPLSAALSERAKDAITFLGPSSLEDILKHLNGGLEEGEYKVRDTVLRSIRGALGCGGQDRCPYRSGHPRSCLGHAAAKDHCRRMATLAGWCRVQARWSCR